MKYKVCSMLLAAALAFPCGRFPWIEVTFFAVSKSIAPIVNLLVTIPLNFIINKLWTFKEK